MKNKKREKFCHNGDEHKKPLCEGRLCLYLHLLASSRLSVTADTRRADVFVKW